MSKFVANIIESERGWGSKIDSTHSFDTVEERDKFVADYNEKYNPPSDFVPDWYMVARAV
jgi:hypothetical protein